jgi:hypothetical protein
MILTSGKIDSILSHLFRWFIQTWIRLGGNQWNLARYATIAAGMLAGFDAWHSHTYWAVAFWLVMTGILLRAIRVEEEVFGSMTPTLHEVALHLRRARFGRIWWLSFAAVCIAVKPDWFIISTNVLLALSAYAVTTIGGPGKTVRQRLSERRHVPQFA